VVSSFCKCQNVFIGGLDTLIAYVDLILLSGLLNS
jgi:hypothetical protein